MPSSRRTHISETKTKTFYLFNESYSDLAQENKTAVLHLTIQDVVSVAELEQYENSPTNTGDGAILEEHIGERRNS